MLIIDRNAVREAHSRYFENRLGMVISPFKDKHLLYVIDSDGATTDIALLDQPYDAVELALQFHDLAWEDFEPLLGQETPDLVDQVIGMFTDPDLLDDDSLVCRAESSGILGLLVGCSISVVMEILERIDTSDMTSKRKWLAKNYLTTNLCLERVSAS